MKHTIEFECGEITCASQPGKFCRFLDRRNVCTLFEKPLYLYKDGQLQRCHECMKGSPNEP